MAAEATGAQVEDVTRARIRTLLANAEGPKLADEIQAGLDVPAEQVRRFCVCCVHAPDFTVSCLLRNAAARYASRVLYKTCTRVTTTAAQVDVRFVLQVLSAIQALLNDGVVQLRKSAGGGGDALRFGLSTDAEITEKNKYATSLSLLHTCSRYRLDAFTTALFVLLCCLPVPAAHRHVCLCVECMVACPCT